MIKVSVIIPVYNVESYLSECLDSIINQTLKDIEIICIDDCSTDNSYNILLEYANKDSRIKIIKNIENNGVGFARNVGQFSAIGDYIYFIDPDDYISLNFLEELYNTAVKYNSDIVNTNNIYNNENDIISRFWGSSDSINVKNDYEVTINFNNIHPSDNNLRIYYTLWTKLFKRSFILENNSTAKSMPYPHKSASTILMPIRRSILRIWFGVAIIIGIASSLVATNTATSVPRVTF